MQFLMLQNNHRLPDRFVEVLEILQTLDLNATTFEGKNIMLECNHLLFLNKKENSYATSFRDYLLSFDPFCFSPPALLPCFF